MALVSGCGTAAQSPSATTQGVEQPTGCDHSGVAVQRTVRGDDHTHLRDEQLLSLLPTAKLLTDNFAKTHPEVKVDTQLIAN